MSITPHLTIAVAGHSGHGKTAVAGYLAGIGRKTAEPQKQAARSGRTQILECPLGTGQSVSLMDVPGHPRLQKNAIRGIAAADVCLLVVAADDGVMPQTMAHINIIKYLKISNGLIVLSKIDLADAETLELAEIEIREAVANTVLADAAVIPFSAVTDTGGQELIMRLKKMAQMIPGRNPNGEFRMWIDEICGVPGFGTVARGAIASGTLSQGDPLWVLPMEGETKARTLEVHHRKVTTAIAGQRVGINLPKISLKEIRRGMALAKKRPERLFHFLNAEISANATLKNLQRVKLYIGTLAANALIILMENQALAAGDAGLVQLRLKHPIFAVRGDAFLICELSTRSIIGGGTVIDPTNEKFRTAKSDRFIPYLSALRCGNWRDAILCYIRNQSHRLVFLTEISARIGIPMQDVQKEIRVLFNSGHIIVFHDKSVLMKNRYTELAEKIHQTIKRILNADPLEKFVCREEIRRIAGIAADEAMMQCVLEDLCAKNRVSRVKGGYTLPDFTPGLNRYQQKLAARLINFALDSGLLSFSPGYFCIKSHSDIKKREVQKVLDFLHDQGELIRLNDGHYLHAKMIDDIKERVATAIARRGSVCLSDSMAILGYGRSNATAVFEYLDDIGFTCRRGDVRTLYR